MQTIFNYISQTEQLVYNYWPLILALVILNLNISSLRSYRIRSISKTVFSNIFLYYSSVKFLAWLLPLRLEEPISAFTLKKLIGKEGWGSSISTIVVTKLCDYSLYILVFFLFFAIYTTGRQNIFLGIAVLTIGILFIFIAFKKRALIVLEVIKYVKFLLTIFPINKFPQKIRMFFSDSSYITRNFVSSGKFWFTTFLISLMQIIFASGIIFSASDKAIDFELFLIVLIYILTQAIPIRLFFGIGIFDITVLIFGYFTTIGFSPSELIQFRALIFVVITLEIVLVLVIYTLINLRKNFGKK